MEKLRFITANGMCGHTEEWRSAEAGFDASDWMDEWEEALGSGVARLPSGGRIDLRQFAVVIPGL